MRFITRLALILLSFNCAFGLSSAHVTVDEAEKQVSEHIEGILDSLRVGEPEFEEKLELIKERYISLLPDLAGDDGIKPKHLEWYIETIDIHLSEKRIQKIEEGSVSSILDKNDEFLLFGGKALQRITKYNIDLEDAAKIEMEVLRFASVARRHLAEFYANNGQIQMAEILLSDELVAMANHLYEQRRSCDNSLDLKNNIRNERYLQELCRLQLAASLEAAMCRAFHLWKMNVKDIFQAGALFEMVGSRTDEEAFELAETHLQDFYNANEKRIAMNPEAFFTLQLGILFKNRYSPVYREPTVEYSGNQDYKIITVPISDPNGLLLE